MGIVIGIDVGGSTTKIVGVEDKKIKNPMFVKATDPVTSLFGAFGKYIYDNNISLSNIEKVILTGVGSAYIDQPLYGLPTAKTDEFLANGLGAQYNTGLDSLLVVSMGTGTSFVKVQGSTIEHIGGLGIGGGTILGLSKLLLKTHDFHQIASLAEHGSLNDIDLHIRDITPHPLPGLPLDVTASIFGKADANAKVEDIALGIVHMVLQTIGQGAVFASLNGDIKNAPTKTIPHFNFEVPTELPGVDPAILDPRDTYADASEWETKALDLADRFVKNFAKYEGNDAGKALVSAGPQK